MAYADMTEYEGNRRFVREAFPHEIAEHERAHRAISYSYPDVSCQEVT
jgi:hypothetical protein